MDELLKEVRLTVNKEVAHSLQLIREEQREGSIETEDDLNQLIDRDLFFDIDDLTGSICKEIRRLIRKELKR